MKIAIASSKDWFILDDELVKAHDIKTIINPSDLEEQALSKFAPDFIFFPHWNWIVPAKVHENYTCVVFHTAPLPFGRGGSPIQNLILDGFNEAPVCAIRMTAELDAGPIFAKKNISLEGPLKEIFKRMNAAINELINKIIEELPEPKAQAGQISLFKRLTSSDNILPKQAQLKEVYDRIRMLDDDSYPSANINHGDLLFEFSDAELSNGEITTTCRISKC
jgi:methionyl-tRNA formyltransferase